jgi:hypothetical protein
MDKKDPTGARASLQKLESIGLTFFLILLETKTVKNDCCELYEKSAF